MPFEIHRLAASSNFDTKKFQYYFLDCNIWIYFLKGQYYPTDGYSDSYVSLVNKIITLNTIPKAKAKPKIVVTSLLLTELINAYLRKIAMKEYCATNNLPYDLSKFKDEYRDKPNTDYKIQLKRLVNDFISFKDSIEIWDDSLIELDPFSILRDLPNYNVDFNDFYYYYRFVGKDVAIVTHDKDFAFADIPIITANPRLLSLQQ